MKKIAAALLVLAAAAPPAKRDDWSTEDLSWLHGSPGDYAESRAICARAINAEPPIADQPTAPEAKALKGCDSEALYYGIGRPADPVAARKCAFTEDEEEAGYFGGRAMLMTIYATGRGAARNIDVATHLACGVGFAPAENNSRVQSLQALKPGDDFSICDDITSGYMMGWCASHGQRISAAKRDQKLATIALRGGYAGAADWKALRTLASAYADHRGSDETDMRGTARGAEAVAAEEEAAEHFAEAMSFLDRGAIPAADANALAKADADLNALWKTTLAEIAADGEGAGAVTRAGMRTAGRAWIAYRDRLVAFAFIHYRRSSPTALRTLLTRQRIDDLKSDYE